MKAICAQTYIPLRALPSDRSEMVSQLLFGEICEIIDENDKWVKVVCEFDNYEGWMFKPALRILSDEEYNVLKESSKVVIDVPILEVHDLNLQNHFYITAGSVIYNLNDSDRSFNLLNQRCKLSGNFPYMPASTSKVKKVLAAAYVLLKTPYLWGGRSTFGIDCSGFVQTCFKIAGIPLPRDASQQSLVGKTVPSIDMTLPADLAFFQNSEGKIIHVGIMLSDSLIIHASNFVQINSIDRIGIIHPETGDYSHRLAIIKRIID
ncbi:MAG: C40 family peptidase [Bacteroidales bacterium]|nr:C40 family peptidase [Bacteroidales bacterium]